MRTLLRRTVGGIGPLLRRLVVALAAYWISIRTPCLQRFEGGDLKGIGVKAQTKLIGEPVEPVHVPLRVPHEKNAVQVAEGLCGLRDPPFPEPVVYDPGPQ